MPGRSNVSKKEVMGGQSLKGKRVGGVPEGEFQSPPLPHPLGQNGGIHERPEITQTLHLYA